MNIVRPILADNSVSITQFKKNPTAALEEADGFPLAVLNHNQASFYCIPAQAYELMMDKLEDIELAQIVMERKDSEEIEMNIDDL